jgi:L-asparagine transporter-like permease
MLGYDVRSLGLDVWWANMETWSLWLVDLVPGMHSNLLDVDSFGGVRIENLCDHVFSLL